jgi:hypothetical protein
MTPCLFLSAVFWIRDFSYGHRSMTLINYSSGQIRSQLDTLVAIVVEFLKFLIKNPDPEGDPLDPDHWLSNIVLCMLSPRKQGPTMTGFRFFRRLKCCGTEIFIPVPVPKSFSSGSGYKSGSGSIPYLQPFLKLVCLHKICLLNVRSSIVAQKVVSFYLPFFDFCLPILQYFGSGSASRIRNWIRNAFRYRFCCSDQFQNRFHNTGLKREI